MSEAMQIEHETDRRACDLAQNLLCMVYQRLEATMRQNVITKAELNQIFGEILPCSTVGKEIIKSLNQ